MCPEGFGVVGRPQPIGANPGLTTVPSGRGLGFSSPPSCMSSKAKETFKTWQERCSVCYWMSIPKILAQHLSWGVKESCTAARANLEEKCGYPDRQSAASGAWPSHLHWRSAPENIQNPLPVLAGSDTKCWPSQPRQTDAHVWKGLMARPVLEAETGSTLG